LGFSNLKRPTLHLSKPDMMVSKKTWIETHSPDETRQLGKKIGNLLNQPIVIALIGGLGCGKTVFVQGLAEGLEVPAEYYITSPTFTLINEYPGRLRLLHVDLYRLDDLSDFEDIGLDEIFQDQAVIAVEWADKMADAFSGDCLSLNFEIIHDEVRKISLIGYGQNGIVLIKTLAKENPEAG
jgi:tRNA threonylcarbamoyladenosine biosynthesis protein TsaE